MKKYSIILLLFMGVLHSYSQSMKVLHEGKEVSETTITINGKASDYQLLIDKVVVKWPGLSANREIQCKRYEIYYINGNNNYICWGTRCEAPFAHSGGSDPVYTLNEVVTFSGTKDSTDSFSGHYLPNGNAGSSKYCYVFFDKNNPTDSTFINVIYNAVDVSGLTELTQSGFFQFFPNPCQTYCEITFSGSHSNQDIGIALINSVGEVVVQHYYPKNSTSFRLNTAALPQGIYWLRSTTNTQIQTQKLLIGN